MKNNIYKKISTLLGDIQNIKTPIFGEGVLWKTKDKKSGFKLQVNTLTGNARIVDEKNRRIAWGKLSLMENKFKNITRVDHIEPGDILGIKRIGGLYEHYAVYIGNDEVIHYSGRGSDFSDEPVVHKANIKDFFNKDKEFFVLDFSDEKEYPEKMNLTVPATAMKSTEEYHLYSPEETIKRAKSRLGEKSYNLALNNCEHFAIWCKTGVSESYQVKRIIEEIAKPLELIIGDKYF